MMAACQIDRNFEVELVQSRRNYSSKIELDRNSTKNHLWSGDHQCAARRWTGIRLSCRNRRACRSKTYSIENHLITGSDRPETRPHTGRAGKVISSCALRATAI